jgi:oxygen-independent coproporphyrinogen-3 oxidase
LRLAGRRHNAADAIQAFETARGRGFRNINVDLIYGLPGQRLEHWEHTLDVAGKLLPESVTCYQLRLKPGTPITRIHASQFPCDAVCFQMGCLMIEKVESCGYRPWQPNQFVLRREDANRYLKSKWEGPAEVVGVGVSAYSFVNNWMYINTRTLGEYYQHLQTGRVPISIGRRLSREQEMAKAVVLGIKVLPNGVDKKAFVERFGVPAEYIYSQTIARLEAAGLVESTPEHLRLARDGLLLADEVSSEFYAEEDKNALREAGATRYGSYLDPIS